MIYTLGVLVSFILYWIVGTLSKDKQEDILKISFAYSFGSWLSVLFLVLIFIYVSVLTIYELIKR